MASAGRSTSKPHQCICRIVISTYGWETSGPSTVNSNGAAGERRSHEKATQELATDITANPHLATLQPLGFDNDRGTTIALVAFGLHTQLAQRIEQISNGSLAHPRDAIEPITSSSEPRPLP